MSKAQEFVDFLNKRIADTGYNERQVLGNKVHFSLMQGPKFARIVRSQSSSYAFVDADGFIFKSASWKAPAKGARATVDQVIGGNHSFFNKPGQGFDAAAYSTIWLYAS